MKKLICAVLIMCVAVSFIGCKPEVVENDVKAETFTVVKIPFPETIDDRQSWITYARYKDTKEPITLSSYLTESIPVNAFVISSTHS